MRFTSTTVLNLVVGVWFAAAAFLWHRTGAERLNALVLAAIVLSIGFGAARLRALRWLDVPLGLWCIASIWLVPHQDWWTSWNLAVFGAALIAMPPTVSWLGDGSEADRALT